VGKTHVPSVYAKLTKKQLVDGKWKIPENKLANISFHNGKN